MLHIVHPTIVGNFAAAVLPKSFLEPTIYSHIKSPATIGNRAPK